MGNFALEIGTAYTFAKTFSELDISLFAELTGDFVPVPAGEALAAASPRTDRMVHGCLIFSLASTVSGIAAMGNGRRAISWGFDALRFHQPVYCGDTISATYTVTSINHEERLITADCIMTNLKGELVLTAIHHLKLLD